MTGVNKDYDILPQQHPMDSSYVAYEGASNRYLRDRRELLLGSPDRLLARELLMLQMRVAHAIRNNGYAKTAKNKYVTNLSAISVKWKDKKGKEHKRMQAQWDAWAKNPNIDGYGSFATTQSLYHSSIFSKGNAYCRLRVVRKNNKNPIPLKLELLQPETHYVEYFGDQTASNGDVRYGIRFDQNSKPVTYFFRNGLFLENWYNVIDEGWKIIEIPASEIIHGFTREFPKQWLGVPMLAAVLIPLYELDELTDATIAKQKAAQVISWVIKNTNPLNPVPIGSVKGVPDYTSGKEDGDKNRLEFQAEGTNVQYLGKNEDIQFFQGTDIGENLLTLMKDSLRKIANSTDLPYHQLTGDLSGVNFSSLRALGNELRQSIEHNHHIFTIPLFIEPVAMKFKEFATMYDSKVSDAVPSFQLPRHRGIDDLKDAQGDLLEIVSGLDSISNKWAERNVTEEQIQESLNLLKSIGLEHLIMGKEAQNASSGINNVEPNSNSTGI